MPLFENHWEQGWEAPDFPELTPERLRSFADFHTRTIRTEPTINTEKSHIVDDENLDTTQLLITPVPRPADVPATIGWPAPLTMITAAPASLRCYAAGKTASVPSSLA